MATATKQRSGKVVQVIGPVIDVEFPAEAAVDRSRCELFPRHRLLYAEAVELGVAQGFFRRHRQIDSGLASRRADALLASTEGALRFSRSALS